MSGENFDSGGLRDEVSGDPGLRQHRLRTEFHEVLPLQNSTCRNNHCAALHFLFSAMFIAGNFFYYAKDTPGPFSDLSYAVTARALNRTTTTNKGGWGRGVGGWGGSPPDGN